MGISFSNSKKHKVSLEPVVYIPVEYLQPLPEISEAKSTPRIITNGTETTYYIRVSNKDI